MDSVLILGNEAYQVRSVIELLCNASTYLLIIESCSPAVDPLRNDLRSLTSPSSHGTSPITRFIKSAWTDDVLTL